MANQNITPQYQSYGETSARGDQSPMEALTFKVPLTPISKAYARKRKVKVMDEDEYIGKVEKIIERDFFPELEKLKAQSDYIDARERKDYETMSRLEEKYSGVRPDTGKRLQSPATFETPLDEPRDNDPRRSDKDPNANAACDSAADANESKSDKDKNGEEEEEKINLDQFMANNTSEDNESFIELQVEEEKKHRIKNAWMYKDEALYLEMKAKQMALPSVEQQAALPYKPGNLDTWTYQNINSVFHNPEGMELTDKEKIEKAKKEKIILHGNTRISKAPWRSEKQMDKLRREVEHKEALAAGKVGIDGKELVRPETPSVNGFKLMSMTPSPALGVEDSPLMTWGEVDTTPYMLGGCDTPLVTSGGAGGGFQIQETSARDRIAHQLAENNSRYYRERKMKAMQQVKSSLKAGKGLANMSPAAQRLASGKLGIRVGTDSMLKASYTPSPARKTPGSTPTPRSTPSRTPSSKSKVTPKLGVRTKTPGTGKTSSDITDNLLDINLSKSNDKVKVNTDNLLQISSSSRPRASDFFKQQ